MDAAKREVLQAAGWKFGDTADFLGMSDEERRVLNARVEDSLNRRNRPIEKESLTTLANLFDDIPDHLPDELFTTLLENAQVRIERIVSHGHASPPGFWYDQDQQEWVVVLRGTARIHFEGEEALVEMKAGDFITIAAHRRHRVAWTTPDEPTVWLAVHFGEHKH